MTDWLTFDLHSAPAVLVTVAQTEGSCPREAGAAMLVTANAQCDTIGGGHLELQACDIARDMLKQAAPCPRLERFALGPSLGQCCGGVMHLAFERIDSATPSIACLRQQRQRHEACWRLTLLGPPAPDHAIAPAAVFNRTGTCLCTDGADGGTMPHAPFAIEFERPAYIAQDRTGRRWLVAPCLPDRPHLVLFGAGHVGAAIVRALADLPCRITWVDEREDLFPPEIPPNVHLEVSDAPEYVADDAPADSSFLVLTHSHALDLRLCERILRRPASESGGWLGLIGSLTKRKLFERRLAERGIEAQRIADMACPIGLPGITGKAPAVIAASVAAQLLQVWETQAHMHTQKRTEKHIEKCKESSS